MEHRDNEHRNLLIGLLFVAVLILSVLAIVTAVQQGNIADNQDQIKKGQVEQDRAAFATCERIQTLRDAVNLHTNTDYQRGVRRLGPNHPYTRSLRYAPPTHCAIAEHNPDVYVTPKLVPFEQVACRFTREHPRPAPLPVCPLPRL